MRLQRQLCKVKLLIVGELSFVPLSKPKPKVYSSRSDRIMCAA
jgi:hypothetical protein